MNVSDINEMSIEEVEYYMEYRNKLVKEYNASIKK